MAAAAAAAETVDAVAIVGIAWTHVAKAIAIQTVRIVRYAIMSPVFRELLSGECILSARIRQFMQHTLEINRYCN